MPINSLFNHLWQSTLFAALVAMLTVALRKNQARWRCRLWLAASVKFLIPFSVLAGIGSRLGWRTTHLAATGFSVFVEQINQSIAPPALHQAVFNTSSAAVSRVPAWLAILWLTGFAVALFRWWTNWRRVLAAVDAAVRLEDGREVQSFRRLQRLAGLRRPIELKTSAGHLEPGVFGVLRTVLLWPAGISDRLADAQLEAIMAHEIWHVRRRDNLAAAFHMFVECIFWFHPLVWWLGARMVDEREKACDEEVIAMGSAPEVYAESILKTCQFYLEAPRMCMAGVTGSDLKQRIERIMTRRVGRRLDFGRKLLLAAAGIAAVGGPIVFGVASAPAIRAQSPAAASGGAPAFEVASVKPSSSDDQRMMFEVMDGRVVLSNMNPKTIITMAYQLKPNQLSGGPAWIDSVRYNIEAKAAGPDDPDRMRLMMQTLLADRFKLAIHRETKDMPIYELVAGKNGTKLKPSQQATDRENNKFRIGRGLLDLEGASMAQLADGLSRVVGRNVFDRTGIAGKYDIKLEWTPDESEAPMMGPPGAAGAPAPSGDSGPSLSTAIQEQLGLKLEAGKGPVEMVVIDHIEKATEN